MLLKSSSIHLVKAPAATAKIAANGPSGAATTPTIMDTVITIPVSIILQKFQIPS